MKRERINWLGASVLESAVIMSEGNPGAATLIGRLMVSEKGVLGLMRCDDYDIRGHQLWIAYKDICKEDFQYFFDEITYNCRDLASRVHAIESGELDNREWFSP